MLRIGFEQNITKGRAVVLRQGTAAHQGRAGATDALLAHGSTLDYREAELAKKIAARTGIKSYEAASVIHAIADIVAEEPETPSGGGSNGGGGGGNNNPPGELEE